MTAAAAFIRSNAGYANAFVDPNLSAAFVTVELQATSTGPVFNMLITFPANTKQNEPALTFSGLTTFLESTNTSLPDAGAMLMQSSIASTVTAAGVASSSLSLYNSEDLTTATKPWSGVSETLYGVPMYFNGTLGGSVSLSRVE